MKRKTSIGTILALVCFGVVLMSLSPDRAVVAQVPTVVTELVCLAPPFPQVSVGEDNGQAAQDVSEFQRLGNLGFRPSVMSNQISVVTIDHRKQCTAAYVVFSIQK